MNIDDSVPDIYRSNNLKLKTIKRPRILKSHHSYIARYKKVIYLARNPIDVLKPYYIFKLKFKKINHSDELFISFIDDLIYVRIDDFGNWNSNICS